MNRFEILITRNKKSALSFAKKIEKLKITPVYLPVFKLECKEISKKTLSKALKCKWWIFTSINAVNFFLKRNLEKFNINELNKRIKIASIGENVKSEINKLGFNVSFIPEKSISEDLAKNLPAKKNEIVFYPASSLANNNIELILKERGIKLLRENIYNNIPIIYNKKKLESILSDKLILITFLSPSAVYAFDKNLKINKLSCNTKVICIGPTTKTAAEKLGYNVISIPKRYNIEGLLAEIKNYIEILK